MSTFTRPAKYRVNVDSWTVLRDLIAKDEPFNRVVDSFHGYPCSADHGFIVGELPSAWRDQFNMDTRFAGGIDYIVYSYRTPIAWRRADSHLWTMPDVRYSVTTSKHAGRLRPAIGASR